MKVFLLCIMTLIFFNLLFWILGLNYEFITITSIISIFLVLGGIAIVVAIIPTTNAGGAVLWLMSMVIMAGLFYKVQVGILQYNIQVGIGLSTNLANMFSTNINELAFLPYIFFQLLGLGGVISGMVLVASSGEG